MTDNAVKKEDQTVKISDLTNFLKNLKREQRQKETANEEKILKKPHADLENNLVARLRDDHINCDILSKIEAYKVSLLPQVLVYLPDGSTKGVILSFDK